MDDGLSNKHPGKVLSTVEGLLAGCGWTTTVHIGIFTQWRVPEEHWEKAFNPWLKKNPIQWFFSLSFWLFNLKLQTPCCHMIKPKQAGSRDVFQVFHPLCQLATWRGQFCDLSKDLLFHYVTNSHASEVNQQRASLFAGKFAYWYCHCHLLADIW